MRVYEGKPSITTVLKILKDSDEFERFKQFDIAGFKQMMQSKAAQGNLLHTAIHDTYKSGKYKSPACPHSKAWMKFYVKEWHAWKPKHLEYFLSCDEVAGTCDYIGTAGSKDLCLVDWKSVWAKIYDELIFKYKMQVSKYASMFNLTSPEKIKHCRIVAFSKDWWYRIIEIGDIEYYASLYDQVLEQFISLRNQYNEIQSWVSWIQESSLWWYRQVTDTHTQISLDEIVNDLWLIDWEI